MMTKKDFEAVAKSIRAEVDTRISEDDKRSLRRLAGQLSCEFKASNPNFDAHRFLTACGF